MGTLMGEKIVLTELIAYANLSELINNNALSDRTAIIASYALCGFAKFWLHWNTTWRNRRDGSRKEERSF